VQQLTAPLIDVPVGSRPWHGDWESAAQQSDGALSVQASVGAATARRLAQTVNSDAHRRIKDSYSTIHTTAIFHIIGSLRLMRHCDRALRGKLQIVATQRTQSLA
jgi:hypothetical protein